ncbi:MAG TPA: GAF domain-containing protein [Anaerolineales bacterium]|nr:GAF domain-containing protein [Anaerolineales bacterium]
MAKDITHGDVYRAATASFDYYNPALALGGLLRLTCELLHSPRSALYELAESQGGFNPRIAHGIPVTELGRLPSSSDHPILKEVLSNRRASASGAGRSALGLPLAPGTVACAPCTAGGQTVGMLFAATDDQASYPPEALETLEVLAARAAEVLTFARQTASQSYVLHKLSLLYEAAHAISGTRDRQEAVRQTAAHLLRATTADMCEALILDEGEGMTTRFRHQHGKSPQQSIVSLVTDRMPDYPVHRQVLSELRPAVIGLAPAQGSARDLAMLQQEGIHAAAIFPLAARNQALGIVRLLYTQPGRLINEQEMELAKAVINVGAVGLQDAIHLESSESRASQLQVLTEIGREMTSTLDLEVALENAMRHTQRLLQVEACVLFLLDEAGQELVLKASGGAQLRIRGVAIRLEEGIAGWVARNRKPLIVNDVRSNPLYHSAIDGQTGLLTTSVLCVPLETRGEALGVIEAINHPRGAFTESDQRVLENVASWAGIAVDNANLFRRVAEERSRLETTLVETADAVVLTDRAGKIILINKAAGQAFRINAELAQGRPAQDIFVGHPLGDLLIRDDISLPTTMEITTPTERVLYATISEVTDVGRVAVMQDITALKQIDRMRSQLLGTAAHDLKNPLNAIRLGADLLHDAQLSDQQRKALNMMQRATDSMTHLITGLLETIRVESTANIALEPCQINDLIRHAIEDLRPLAEERDQTVEYRPPDESLLIMGDPGRLTSVMTNLLSNAIKFTSPGGRIRVDARWDEDEVVVSVSDNGPGIPEDEVPRVFEHLFRGRLAVQDPSNPVEGTGLGLALAKTVIEQHGGRIWVNSVEGKGSTFYVSLPREPTPKTGSLRKD